METETASHNFERVCVVSHVVPLELLTAGEEARIVDVEGRPELVDRLAEMGLREGVVLRMVRPGQPCILAIGNHRLSFRGDEAASVFVEMVAVGSGT